MWKREFCYRTLYAFGVETETENYRVRSSASCKIPGFSPLSLPSFSLQSATRVIMRLQPGCINIFNFSRGRMTLQKCDTSRHVANFRLWSRQVLRVGGFATNNRAVRSLYRKARSVRSAANGNSSYPRPIAP